jgi:Sulfotransferase domain
MSLGDEAAVPASQRTGTSPDHMARPARSRERLAYLRQSASLPVAVKRAAHSLVVTTSLPTSGRRMLPGFLIVGAQRCGTTSMARILGQHPAVANAAMHREVHYFDNAYNRSLAWYRSHFPLVVRARRAAAVLNVAPIAFESSPYYMFHPLAAQRILHDLPGVKLLVLLRDPVERTYSAHAHEVAHGFETETYERAMELEESRLNGEAERILADPTYNSYSHQHHSYRARGHYAEQLERLAGLFGPGRIHVVDSGDFFAQPRPSYERVLDFLGLPRAGYPDFRRRNARPRSAPMPSSIRAELEEYYRPHDERLARWLPRDPSWRR